jgi:hypothetical protein
MAGDPLGPVLIADWVPVWVPVFGGNPGPVRGCRRPNSSPRRPSSPEIFCPIGHLARQSRPLDLGELTGSAPPTFTLTSPPPPEPFSDCTARRSSDGVAGRGVYEHRRQSWATQADGAGDCP